MEKLFDGEHGVCNQRSTVETGMVDRHLLHVGLRSLRIVIDEVCLQFFERSTERVDIAREVEPGGTNFCTTHKEVLVYRTLSLIAALALMVAAGAWACAAPGAVRRTAPTSSA